VIWQALVGPGAVVCDSPGPGMRVCQCAAATLLELNNGAAGAAYWNVRYVLERIQ
jgi:hypothetical protein